jgi:hypothetical protein
MLEQVFGTAIGLALTYMILSLMCTALQETIAQFLALRSKNLAAGIKEIAGDIKGSAILQSPLLIGNPEVNKRITNIPAEHFVDAVLQTGDKVAASAEDVKNAVNSLPEGRMKQVLTLYLSKAEDDVTGFRNQIADYYDEFMETVSAEYKQRTHIIMLLLGFGVAVTFNADSIMIAQHIWDNDALRTKLEATAGEVTSAETAAQISNDVRDKALNDLPIGWTCSESEDSTLGFSCNAPDTGYAALLGWLITGFALSFGAKFWFDILKSLINLRGAGGSRSVVRQDKPSNT